jgi:hypothetical protein
VQTSFTGDEPLKYVLFFRENRRTFDCGTSHTIPSPSGENITANFPSSRNPMWEIRSNVSSLYIHVPI